jgi:transcription antitermination factor NusG
LEKYNIDSIATNTGVSERDQQHWFAAYTNSCQEKRVAQHLTVRDIEFFLPLSRRINRWKNGLRVNIETPLFPGYVFVRIRRGERVRIMELPGVHSIVGFGRDPIALPEEQIEAMRQGLHGLNAEPHPYLSVGAGARIRRGALEGMTGIVVRKKNGFRFVLSLDLIQKSVSVEVDESNLEAIPGSRDTTLSTNEYSLSSI